MIFTIDSIQKVIAHKNYKRLFTEHMNQSEIKDQKEPTSRARFHMF